MNEITRLINNKQFKQALERVTAEIYIAAYQYSGYNQVATAKLLGISRGTLRTRLAKLKID